MGLRAVGLGGRGFLPPRPLPNGRARLDARVGEGNEGSGSCARAGEAGRDCLRGESLAPGRVWDFAFGTAMHVACLVLSDPAGTILAVCRPEGKALGGLWEFPGGKVEPGETPELCLRREIREELGIGLPRELQALTPVDHTYAFGAIRLLPYLARMPQRPGLELREHAALRWLFPEEWPLLSWAPADLPLCREIEKRRGELFAAEGDGPR